MAKIKNITICLQKMAEELAKAGLYLDDLNKIRIVDLSVFQHANDLKDGCKIFDDST